MKGVVATKITEGSIQFDCHGDSLGATAPLALFGRGNLCLIAI